MRRAVVVLVLVAAAVVVLNSLYQHGWVRFNYPSRETFPVRGIDVSHHQGAVAWSAVRAAGIEFAFIKASEGADHRDREFAESWRRAQEAGVARGAYHFFTFCTSGLAQAENFIAAVGSSFGELPPVADVEFSGNRTQWESVERIRVELSAFLARVEGAAQRRPIPLHRRRARTNFGGSLRRRSLMAAQRPSTAFIPLGGVAVLELADNGRVPGIRTLVDLNVFRGQRAEFESVLRVAPAPGG